VVGIKVPVIPGIMPIQTYSSFARVTKLCGARVPASVADALATISVSPTNLAIMPQILKLFQHDDELVKDYGVKLAVEIIQKLTSGCSIAGFHFCTLNLEKSVQRVLETLEWTGSSHPVSSAPNKLIVVSNTTKLDVILFV